MPGGYQSIVTLSLCKPLWRGRGLTRLGWQVRPHRKLPPEFSRPSGKPYHKQKRQPVFCPPEAAAAAGGSKNGIFLSGTFGSGKGFSETAGTKIRMMVTCQQRPRERTGEGRLDSKGLPYRKPGPVCNPHPSGRRLRDTFLFYLPLTCGC